MKNIKEQCYMCVNCGGEFSRDEMYFEIIELGKTKYDCDFCYDCNKKVYAAMNRIFPCPI